MMGKENKKQLGIRAFKAQERKRMKEPIFSVKEYLKPKQEEKKHKPIGTGSKKRRKEDFISIQQKLKNREYYQIFPVDNMTLKMVQHDPRALQKFNGAHISQW